MHGATIKIVILLIFVSRSVHIRNVALFPLTVIQVYTKDVKWSLIFSHLNGNSKYISINCHKYSF
jgi:hypothetical protein